MLARMYVLGPYPGAEIAVILYVVLGVIFELPGFPLVGDDGKLCAPGIFKTFKYFWSILEARQICKNRLVHIIGMAALK